MCVCHVTKACCWKAHLPCKCLKEFGPCSQGTFQNLPGESSCIPCELGRFSDQPGSAECTVCDLGGYANETGMTFCHQCGANTTQMDQWTTSKSVMDQGGIKWIPIQGAVSENFCGCVEGTYLHDGLCQPCIEGSICRGSSKLELLPGPHKERVGSE